MVKAHQIWNILKWKISIGKRYQWVLIYAEHLLLFRPQWKLDNNRTQSLIKSHKNVHTPSCCVWNLFLSPLDIWQIFRSFHFTVYKTFIKRWWSPGAQKSTTVCQTPERQTDKLANRCSHCSEVFAHHMFVSTQHPTRTAYIGFRRLTFNTAHPVCHCPQRWSTSLCPIKEEMLWAGSGKSSPC